MPLARQRDRLLTWTLRGCAAVSGLIVCLILIFLAIESTPALLHVGPRRFFTDASWHPAPAAADGQFNLVPMIAGTLAVSAGAVLWAAPLGVGSALFCHFYAPAGIAGIYRRVIELLAGVPSVVFGLWGLLVLAPIILAWSSSGLNLLTGILVLGIMILPIMALVADAALAAVPREHLQVAAALGLSRWTTIRHVVLPSAKSGLVTGLLLQSGRAIGETMAVLMVCGNVVRMPGGLFEPVRTLTANIALEAEYALGDHRSALFVSGLLLMLIVVGLVALAEVVSNKYDDLGRPPYKGRGYD